MADRYLKMAIVVRNDLGMPRGKAMAMAAHAGMTFIVRRLRQARRDRTLESPIELFTEDEWRWMTELDPGIEDKDQISMAKVVLKADSEEELWAVYEAAVDAGLQAYPVHDSGHSHNPAGAFVAVAVGPGWPEEIDPVTGALALYR